MKNGLEHFYAAESNVKSQWRITLSREVVAAMGLFS